MHEELRDGHRVKLYRTTAKEFIVPFTVSSSATLETHFKALGQTSIKLLAKVVAEAMQARNPDWGFRIYPGPKGGAVQSTCPLDEDGQPLSIDDLADAVPCTFGDIAVILTDDEAAALMADIKKLDFAYYNKPKGEGRRYYLSLAVVPI